MKSSEMIVGGIYRNMTKKEFQDYEYLGENAGGLSYFRNLYTKYIVQYFPDQVDCFVCLTTKPSLGERYLESRFNNIETRYFLGFVLPEVKDYIELSQMGGGNLMTLESALETLEDCLIDCLQDFESARIYEFQGLREIPIEIESVKVKVIK